jgi:hypothetical protein
MIHPTSWALRCLAIAIAAISMGLGIIVGYFLSTFARSLGL